MGVKGVIQILQQKKDVMFLIIFEKANRDLFSPYKNTNMVAK